MDLAEDLKSLLKKGHYTASSFSPRSCCSEKHVIFLGWVDYYAVVHSCLLERERERES